MRSWPSIADRLNRILKEAVEGGEHFRNQRGQIEVTHKFCGLGDDIVIAMRQSFRRGSTQASGRLLAKRIGD